MQDRKQAGMAFCGKCGTAVNEGSAFCPKCGAPVGAAAPPPPPYAPYPAQPATSGLQENVAGALCYLFGWVTGIIFLLIDKRPFVRFHAAQSIVVFGILHVAQILLTYVWLGGASYAGFWAIHGLLSMLVGLLTIAAWIVLILMAYQGKEFEVPVVAGIARSLAGSVK